MKKKNLNIKTRLLHFVCGFLIPLTFVFSSCKKAWLEAKPDQKLVVPSTINDLQALLDYTDIYNIDQPTMGEIGSDDYFINYTTYLGRSDKDRNVYSWASTQDFYAGANVSDWEYSYREIFYANTVIEGVKKIRPVDKDLANWSNVLGSALYFRAEAYYKLAQLFCKPYSDATASEDLGVVLRLTSNFNEPSSRTTVKTVYEQIISDLMAAKSLLPINPLYKTRPSKPAAFAMLARTFLLMGDYTSALNYSDSCIQVNGSLIDYNSLDTTSANPVYPYNNNIEVIYHSRLLNTTILPQNSGSGYVDTALVKLYEPNDLRKKIFFKQMSDGRYAFIGSYNNTIYLFSGIAVDEMYLIRAECNARLQKIPQAMLDLNYLIQKRWNKLGTYQPITANDSEAALRKILTERRKELCFRGIRWSDIRRLNLDPRFAITLTHGVLKAVTPTAFTISPNSERYVLPIPNSEMLYSNIPQNPR